MRQRAFERMGSIDPHIGRVSYLSNERKVSPIVRNWGFARSVSFPHTSLHGVHGARGGEPMINPLQVLTGLGVLLNWRNWKRSHAEHAEMLEILRRNDARRPVRSEGVTGLDEIDQVKMRARTETGR
jgi:hypothetical protein